MLNDEQKAAQDELQAAVEKHVMAYRNGTDDGVVSDWILVSSTSGFNDEGGGTSGYHLAFMGGEMPEHRAVGLLLWGIQILKTIDRESE